MLLNNEWINNKIKEEIKGYLETNGNDDTTIQNLQETGKAILRWKFIAFQAHLQKTNKQQQQKTPRKQEKAQINNLTSNLKELGKEQQTKPNVSRRKEIIKIRAAISEIDSLKNDTKYQ